MRKKLALFVAVAGMFGVTEVAAQNPECNTNLSLYVQDAKVKNYDAAYEPWKMVYENCPDLHYANFVYGERILEHKMESDAANKDQYVQDLLGLYDGYYKYFGPEAGKKKKYYYSEMVSDKVKLMNSEGLGTDQEIYDMVHEALQKDKDNLTSELVLYIYFKKTVDLYKAEQLDLQVVFDTYDDVSERIEELRNDLAKTMNPLVEKQEAGTELTAKEAKTLSRSEKIMSNYNDISGSLDSYLGQLADCDNLIPLYEKNFEANKSDEEWLNRAASRMTEKECTDSELYVKIVEQLHSLHPSASSARFLGVIAYKKGDKQGAIKWFKESIELEGDKFKKSKTALQIAGLYSGSASANWAREALKYNPSNNKAWSIIAHAYADSANSCGSTTFEKKAVYWLAAEAARKGGDTKLANTYEKYAPTKTEIFDANMSGKTLKIGCWINRSVKVPSL
ncbi:hypothetical protein [Pustulibacterium marinum]|nr:hypothetical protein [Pustulibacterium marinum]